jgi:hypothetical protein
MIYKKTIDRYRTREYHTLWLLFSWYYVAEHGAHKNSVLGFRQVAAPDSTSFLQHNIWNATFAKIRVHVCLSFLMKCIASIMAVSIVDLLLAIG